MKTAANLSRTERQSQGRKLVELVEKNTRSQEALNISLLCLSDHLSTGLYSGGTTSFASTKSMTFSLDNYEVGLFHFFIIKKKF